MTRQLQIKTKHHKHFLFVVIMLMQHMIQSGPAQIQSQVGGRIWSHSWRFKKFIDDKNPTLPL
jgi:hypothetical protein